MTNRTGTLQKCAPHKNTYLTSSLSGAILSLLLITSVGSAAAQDTLSPPHWPDLFDANGTLKDVVDETGAAVSNGVPDYVDLYGGIDAVFVGDNISDGVAADMSALRNAQSIEDTVIYNNTVPASHDVGNAFVFATSDSQGNYVISGAVERIAPSAENSYIEFEFTQEVVQAISAGSPLRGSRTDGDLRVRLNLEQGILTSAELGNWSDAQGFQTVSSITVSGGLDCTTNASRDFQVCDPYLASGLFDYQTQFNAWNDPLTMGGDPVQVAEPNGLLEFAVNVGTVLGANPDYTSIIVRTPEDAILATFRNLGYWAQVRETLLQGSN